MLECKVGSLSIIYLGTPLRWKKLKTHDWDFLINKVEKKLASWKEKMLSLGVRLTLIKLVLGVIPIYWMSVFKYSDYHPKLEKDWSS
jgi:hypothetical protein